MLENENVTPLTDEEIEKELKKYYSSNLPNTRNYIISKLKENPKWKGKLGLYHKQDFIDEYFKRIEEGSRKLVNYDFSKIPEIVSNKSEKIPIIVNEVSPATNKLIGDWETSWVYFLTCNRDNIQIAGIIAKEKNPYILTNEEFIKRSKERFGENSFGYDKVNIINVETPVLLKCNKCGNYFEQKPTNHLYGKYVTGYGCQKCCIQKRAFESRKTIDDFKNKMIELYGEDQFSFEKSVYINSKTPIIITDIKTGIDYSAVSNEFYKRDPRPSNKSTGETLIKRFFRNNNITYESQVRIPRNIIKGKKKCCKSGVIIDFVLNLNDQEIWIEYDGLQHFKFGYYFSSDIDEFLGQVKRDYNVRYYCNINCIKFIRIPYTYDTYDKIDNLLTDILINNKEVLISLPSYKFPKGYSMKDVYKLIEEEGGIVDVKI